MAQFITDAGLLRVLLFLSGEVTHVGVSSGAAPSPASTKLSGEFSRVEIVDPLTDGYTLVLDGYFDETKANGTITGWGAFGNGATNALNTGELFAATDANITKTNTESLTLSVEITVRRVTT